MNSNVQLEELANGALAEKFQQVLAKVVDNLRDVNTSYKTKRRITIQLDFIQDESREDVRCDVAVGCKLAQPRPMSTRLAIGRDLRTDELYVAEYGKQIKGQMSIDDIVKTDEPEEKEPTEKKVVNINKAI
ncbi:MAG: hypothetical protein BHV87_07785 [Clostridiales bacterium 36_14]|nr:MAG: hypothetical protein BHV87_07785 [Clostridiales bacterium 36_14]DAS27779.1 MAG TPA: hypothetical protein [Caudoviricetes sp.]